MGREGDIAFLYPLPAHEDGVGDGSVVVIGVRSSKSLFVPGFKRTRNGGSALWSRWSSAGFGRMVDEVTDGPFGATRETSEEAGPSGNGEKCETSEKENGRVENETSVAEGGSCYPDG